MQYEHEPPYVGCYDSIFCYAHFLFRFAANCPMMIVCLI
jgi:hypothetical protein